MPTVELSVTVLLLESELLHDVLLRRLVRIEVESIQRLKRLLRVPVGRVGHPTARLHLVGVESPEFELLLEERTAHVGRVVQLAGTIVVEDLSEDARMSVEEVLVENRIVVGERLGETREPGGGDLLERRLVRLVADASDVENDAVLGIRHLDGLDGVVTGAGAGSAEIEDEGAAPVDRRSEMKISGGAEKATSTVRSGHSHQLLRLLMLIRRLPLLLLPGTYRLTPSALLLLLLLLLLLEMYLWGPSGVAPAKRTRNQKFAKIPQS